MRRDNHHLHRREVKMYVRASFVFHSLLHFSLCVLLKSLLLYFHHTRSLYLM